MSPPRLVFKGPFTVLSTTGTNLQCEFWTMNFTSTNGEYLTGNFTSDNPINFFVVQEAKYQDWLKGGNCGNTGDSITSQLMTTGYPFNAAIPSPGTWVIVLVNASNAKNADGFLTAYLSTLAYTVTELMTSTITPTIVTSTTSQPTTSNTNLQLASELGIATIIAGSIVGLAAILIMNRRRRSQSKS
jgi:hypothetical protein